MTDEKLKQIEKRLRKIALGAWATADMKAVLAEVKDLKDLLNEYGRHQEGCNASCNTDNATHKRYPCKCGYEREVENR